MYMMNAFSTLLRKPHLSTDRRKNSTPYNDNVKIRFCFLLIYHVTLAICALNEEQNL